MTMTFLLWEFKAYLDFPMIIFTIISPQDDIEVKQEIEYKREKERNDRAGVREIN